MDRVQKGSSVTITHTFTVDGVATDPSPVTATVEVVRDDGSVVVVAGASTVHVGTGKFTFTLTPTHTALLDILTARWTATFAGQPQTVETQVEVVGGFLFTLADARADSQLADAAA